MKKTADVTILTANYNNAPFIDEYAKSIIQSTVLPKKVIFVDDASTDESVAVLKKYAAVLPLEIIQLTEQKGFANALNAGIEKIDSLYVMRLDSDDFIHHTRIEKQWKFLAEHPETDMVGSNCFYYNDGLKKNIFRSKFPTDKSGIYESFFHGDIGLMHSSVMGKTEVFRIHKYDQFAYPAEDYDIFSRMVIRGVSMVNLKEPLLYYRIHNFHQVIPKIRNVAGKILFYREKYFHRRKNIFRFYVNYWHFMFYRKFLLYERGIFSYFYLFCSGLVRFDKLIKRFLP